MKLLNLIYKDSKQSLSYVSEGTSDSCNTSAFLLWTSVNILLAPFRSIGFHPACKLPSTCSPFSYSLICALKIVRPNKSRLACLCIVPATLVPRHRYENACALACDVMNLNQWEAAPCSWGPVLRGTSKSSLLPESQRCSKTVKLLPCSRWDHPREQQSEKIN